MLRKLVPSGVFGAVDGTGLAIGLLLALGRHAIIPAVVANASTDFASMSSGSWLEKRDEELRVAKSLMNGTCSALGALFPILVYVLFGTTGAIVGLVLWVVFLAWVRPSDPSWVSWRDTFASVAFVTLAAFGAVLILKLMHR